jgi:hypothetical protein
MQSCFSGAVVDLVVAAGAGVGDFTTPLFDGFIRWAIPTFLEKE